MSDLKLREFLREGCIIRTKLIESPSWVTNAVYSINDEYLEIDIGLEKNYLDNIIMLGDTIKCKFANEEYEYNFIGWVTKVKMDFPQSITLRIHKTEVFENKRDSYRYDVYLSSAVKLKRREKGSFVILTNISRTGAAFAIREEIEKVLDIPPDGKTDILNIFVDVYILPEKIFSFQGAIVRKSNREKGLEYGIQFIDMDIESEKVLNELLDELGKKDREFYNKCSFWSKNSKMNK